MRREAWAVQRRWESGGAVIWLTEAMFDVESSAEAFLESMGGPRRKRIERCWINSGPNIPSDRVVMIPHIEEI
jgi:hypothetical protein